MRMLPDFQRKCHKRGLFAASSLLLVLATQTVGQSGRRAPKPSQPPVTTPETETSLKTSARELKERVSLLVAKQPSSKRLLSEEAIFASFLKQLVDFKNVTGTSI